MSDTLTEYKRGTRVVVTEDLPGVPEGTAGKCGRGLGFAIKRYRVRFDNDVEAMSVAHSKLVPEREWSQFLAQRARAEIEAAQERARVAEQRAAAAESRGLPVGDTSAPEGEAESSTDPAAATEEAAPAGGGSGDEGAEGDSGGDPRLAALMARSKKARDATGVTAPESAAAPQSAPEAAAEPPAAETAPEPAAAPPTAPAPSAPAPARSAAPSGPERVEIPEFVPGPEVEADYTPGANRISELMGRVRKGD